MDFIRAPHLWRKGSKQGQAEEKLSYSGTLIKASAADSRGAEVGCSYRVSYTQQGTETLYCHVDQSLGAQGSSGKAKIFLPAVLVDAGGISSSVLGGGDGSWDQGFISQHLAQKFIFIQQIFIQNLLCATYHPRHLLCISKQKKYPCPDSLQSHLTDKLCVECK